MNRCKNCGERIVLVNFAMGPSWEHQPAGAAFMDQMTRYCRTTVAEPAEVDMFQSLATAAADARQRYKMSTTKSGVEHADFSPDTGHLHSCDGPGSVCNCALLLYELTTPTESVATVKVDDVKRLIPHAGMTPPYRYVSIDVLFGWLNSCGMKNVDWGALVREVGREPLDR